MFLHPPFPEKRGIKRQKSEAGQALVETAISIAMLAIMLIGAAELGRIAYAAIQVTTAAKAAVQYGARNTGTAVDITGMQTAASLAAPELTNMNTNVNTTCLCADGISCTFQQSDCTGSVIVDTLHVTTSVSFDPLFHLPGTPTTYTLYGKAVQQVLSNGF